MRSSVELSLQHVKLDGIMLKSSPGAGDQLRCRRPTQAGGGDPIKYTKAYIYMEVGSRKTLNIKYIQYLTVGYPTVFIIRLYSCIRLPIGSPTTKA